MLFDGYRYFRDRIRNSNSYWRCENRGQCSGCLIQKGDQIPGVAAKHNHEPNKQMLRQKLFITHLKEQIRENAMPIRKFFRGEIVNRSTVEPDSVRVPPQFNQIKNSLYQMKNLNYPPLPKSIEDVCIEGNKLIKSDYKLLNELLFKGKWRLLLNGEDFTLIDNKNLRYFIFGTTDSLKMLCSSDHMFGDALLNPLLHHLRNYTASILNRLYQTMLFQYSMPYYGMKIKLNTPHSLTT